MDKIIISFNTVISQHNPHSHYHQATTIINPASGLPLSNQINTSIKPKKKKSKKTRKLEKTIQKTYRQPTDPHPQSLSWQPQVQKKKIKKIKKRLAIKRNSPPQPNRQSRENQQPRSKRVDLIHNKSATRLESATWVSESEVF